ncbi:hypothetical protein CRG98_024331, partial [Punica granatum]
MDKILVVRLVSELKIPLLPRFIPWSTGTEAAKRLGLMIHLNLIIQHVCGRPRDCQESPGVVPHPVVRFAPSLSPQQLSSAQLNPARPCFSIPFPAIPFSKGEEEDEEMSREQKRDELPLQLQLQDREEDREAELGSEEPETPVPLTVTSRLLYMLGDITAGSAYRFNQWLELVRKRSSTHYRASGFPHRPHHHHHLHDTMPSSSSSPPCEAVPAADPRSNSLPTPEEQCPDISLWERLGKAAPLDIESTSFSWNTLSSLHHTEHSTSTEHSEDEMNKALE